MADARGGLTERSPCPGLDSHGHGLVPRRNPRAPAFAASLPGVCLKAAILGKHLCALKSYYGFSYLPWVAPDEGMQLWGRSAGEERGKGRMNASTWRRGKKITINHLIINHSFLRLITQLLVTISGNSEVPRAWIRTLLSPPTM